MRTEKTFITLTILHNIMVTLLVKRIEYPGHGRSLTFQLGQVNDLAKGPPQEGRLTLTMLKR